MLSSKKKELKKEGKGNKPNTASALGPDEENKLWMTGNFGFEIENSCRILFGTAQLKGLGLGDVRRQNCFSGVTLVLSKMGMKNT